MFRKNCLVCDSKNIIEIINLGMHPFADTFIPKEKLGIADKAYPLVCDLCKECGHVQTRCETDPEERYSQIDYSYTSSNSAFSRKHWDECSESVLALIKDPQTAFVIEAGSNDGYLCEQLMKKGAKVLGVDPSHYMAKLAEERGVSTMINLFDEDIVEKIISEHGKADVVISNNVFNHSNNPLGFAKAVEKVLKETGHFVFEQPYWVETIKTGRFDQIYHEHISYFTMKSVSELLKRAGLSVKSAEVVDYHGGSLKIVAQKSSQIMEKSKSEKILVSAEENLGLFNSNTYKEYMKKNSSQKNKFLQKVYGLKESDANIVAVGAAAKGNTFLNYCGLDRNTIDYVTDASQHKKGKYTPLTRIPIVGDEVFSKYDEVYALILSWNIADQLKDILFKINPKIKFLVPD